MLKIISSILVRINGIFVAQFKRWIFKSVEEPIFQF